MSGDPHAITCADTMATLDCSMPGCRLGGRKSPSPDECDPSPRLNSLNHQFHVAIPAVISLGQELSNKQVEQQK
jgi:hypothetical protein